MPTAGSILHVYQALAPDLRQRNSRIQELVMYEKFERGFLALDHLAGPVKSLVFYHALFACPIAGTMRPYGMRHLSVVMG